MFNFLFFLYLAFIIYIFSDFTSFFVSGDIEMCQMNCESSDRLIGPTKMTDTRPHPWKPAEFPSKNSGFCKLGCQIFYTEVPKNTTCYRLCSYFYRYKTTDGYSDLAEQARLECQDGCDIALNICRPGYYCNEGIMKPCPAGTYRGSVENITLISLEQANQCTPCPYGRYRSAKKGKSADDCTKCPIGTYANHTGGTSDFDCKRCPVGTFAEEEGMRVCKCITPESCGLEIAGKTYYSNNVDYFRETLPYIGRW